MAKSTGPILLLGLGGLALLMMGGKKGDGGIEPAGGDEPEDDPDTPIDEPTKKKTSGPGGGGADLDTWKARQYALKYVLGLTGCACDPGAVDGKYGKKTKAAVKGFQIYAGIGVDGKWGPETEEAMSRVLLELQQGIYPPPAQESGEPESGEEEGGEEVSPSPAISKVPVKTASPWNKVMFPNPEIVRARLGGLAPKYLQYTGDTSLEAFQKAITAFQRDWNVLVAFHRLVPTKLNTTFLKVDGSAGAQTLLAMEWATGMSWPLKLIKAGLM